MQPLQSRGFRLAKRLWQRSWGEVHRSLPPRRSWQVREIWKTRSANAMFRHSTPTPPPIPLTPRHNVSLHTQRSQCRPLQGRIPKVRPLVPRACSIHTTNHPTPATTPRMVLSFATSTPAVPLPRRSKPRWVPMVATRSSSITSRR